MTKQEVLAKAGTAVQMMYVACVNYRTRSREYKGATRATREAFLVARAHGYRVREVPKRIAAEAVRHRSAPR